MTFKEWITSSYPNPHVDGQWGLLHILVLVGCILSVVGITLLFKYVKGDTNKKKRIVLWVVSGVILLFELTRRMIYFCTADEFTWNKVLYTIFPRPWCAISCWMVMLATLINKKYFYNFTSITASLCALIFFAYPGVGFNNEYILFENLYSITTHSFMLIGALLFITLKFTDFQFKDMWKSIVCLGVVFVYAVVEIWILKIEKDPLYFMPNNEIMEIFGMDYGLYIVLYILFIAVYWLAFYVIQNRKTVFAKLSKKN